MPERSPTSPFRYAHVLLVIPILPGRTDGLDTEGLYRRAGSRGEEHRLRVHFANNGFQPLLAPDVEGDKRAVRTKKSWGILYGGTKVDNKTERAFSSVSVASSLKR